MSATSSKTLTRLCIGGVAAATIGSALVLPFGAANAAARVGGAPASVTISPTTARTIAGNCQTYTVTVTDASGQPATTTNNTVFVQVSEPTNTPGQTITPCTVDQTTTPTTASPTTSGTPAATAPQLLSTTAPVTLAATPNTATPNNGQFLVSFAASQPGTLNVTPFVDRDNNQTLSGNDLVGSAATETVDPSTGVRQQDVRSLTAAPAAGQPAFVTPNDTSTTNYTITALDASGAPVNGVAVRYFTESGPGASQSTTATPGTTATTNPCSGTTDSNGQITCTVTAPAAMTANAAGTPTTTPSGTQTIRFFADQNGDNAFQSTEPSTTVTRQVVSSPVNATKVTVTPNGQTFPTGQAVSYSALVVDAQGNPVPNTNVYFTQTGAGSGIAPANAVSGPNGIAKATVGAAAVNDTGAQKVTASLTGTPAGAAQMAATAGNSGTCNPTAGATAPAACTATATNTISNVSASPSTSPTASATPTATTSPSATPTASSRPSATPSPSGSVVPPAGVQCTSPLGISINRAYIVPGIPVTVTVTAPVGAEVELQAYSRPSSTFQQVRQSVVGDNGTVSFDVTPGTNTRLFADCVSQTQSVSAQKVINLRTALSLSVVRNGRRNYTFQGRILPRRAGQLITLYRVKNDGTRVLTTQVKTDDTGTYRINRRFTGSGTFGFLTRTGQTLTNASGESTSRSRQTSADYLNTGRGTAKQVTIN